VAEGIAHSIGCVAYARNILNIADKAETFFDEPFLGTGLAIQILVVQSHIACAIVKKFDPGYKFKFIPRDILIRLADYP